MLRKTVAMASFSFMILGLASIGLGYEVTTVSNGGTIAGRIAFSGTPPASRVFDVNKGPEVCGVKRGLTKVDVRHGFLRGAVLVLEGVEKGKSFESKTFTAQVPGEGEFHYAAGETLDLDVRLKNCNFGPFTGVVAVDQPVSFVNQDSIKHTLHTYVLKGQNANILRTLNTQSLAAHSEIEQTFVPKKLKHGRVVALTCDRHDFMENWMYVVETPYFAISDETGNFSIDEVPPGEYQLVAWHPVLGTQRKAVHVDADGILNVSFEFRK
jgi:plastocyanin